MKLYAYCAGLAPQWFPLDKSCGMEMLVNALKNIRSSSKPGTPALNISSRDTT